MAIIQCPTCKKRISDKVPRCQHCASVLDDSDPERTARQQELQAFDWQMRIQNQQIIAILLFVAGFGFMYWGGTQPGELQHSAALATTVIGFFWYAINRIRLALRRRNQ